MTYVLNTNSVVKVRLTSYGKNVHRKNHEDFVSKVGRELFDYFPPPEDENGYSEFQLWVLMKEFGDKCGLVDPLCFETEILIEDKDLKPINETPKPIMNKQPEIIEVNGVKYQRIEEPKKPKTLHEIACKWCDDDANPPVVNLVNDIERQWLLPKETYSKGGMMNSWVDGWNAYRAELINKLK